MASRRGIVAFSFGRPKTIRSNRAIAQLARERALLTGAHVFTQKDVPIDPDIRFGGLVFANQIYETIPPSTLDVSIQATRWIDRNKIDTLEVVAAGPHMWRAHRDMCEVLYDHKPKVTITKVAVVDDDSWFCADSLQWFTRSRKLWELRERLLRKFPFPIYEAIVT